jgi:IS5 family transposase
VIDADNVAGNVWADTAYRSAKNEAGLSERGLVSPIRRKKPPGRPMPAQTRRVNARKSAVRSAVEHVFARRKRPIGLVLRAIGQARAQVKNGPAHPAYNVKRHVWLSGRPAPA